MINKVEISGVNTSKLPLLSNEEKIELFAKIKNGDMEARQTFINGNLRLVLSVIKRFNNRGENIDDLFQVGCVGLIKALDNFNSELGVKFSTYAVPMMGRCRKMIRMPCFQGIHSLTYMRLNCNTFFNNFWNYSRTKNPCLQ